MTKRKAQNRQNNRVKIGKTPHDPSRPIGKGNPPVETQFQPGNTASVGVNKHPKTITELRALVQAIGEELTSDKTLTRLELLLRGQYAARNSSDKQTILAYGWGRVPQPVTFSEMSDEQLADYIKSQVGELGGGLSGSEAPPDAAVDAGDGAQV